MKNVYLLALVMTGFATSLAAAEPFVQTFSASIDAYNCASLAAKVETCMQTQKAGACRDVAADQKKDRVVAMIKLETESAMFHSSRLDQGILGSVRFAPAKIEGDAVTIPSTVRMIVSGDYYCHALINSGGDTTKALQTIISEILK